MRAPKPRWGARLARSVSVALWPQGPAFTRAGTAIQSGGAILTWTIMREMFDAQALFLALDAQREERSLTWPGVARELWEMSSELAKLRGEDHPIAANTLTNLTKRGDTSCQHALFMLRWLGRDPEDFVPGAPASTRATLPSAGPDRRLRWHLHATPRHDVPGLYEALDERRRDRGLAWPALARELRCGPSQLTGLRTARFAVRMTLAMAMTQWLEQPAADFIYAAQW